MQLTIIALEDDANRRRRFTTVARQLNLDIKIWYSAHDFIAQFDSAIGNCVLFSLDCDLIPPDGSEIWGDGEMVARHLAAHQPIAPVIVHSSNREGAARMTSDLTEADWSVHRVAPIGADWIEVNWRWRVTNLLKAQRSG